MTQDTLHDSTPCKCGHPLDWHARGQFRSRWACEFSGCECEDFEPAESATPPADLPAGEGI